SISGGLIGLLILLFRPVAGRFFAKRWIYYLWLLVLIRLLVPIHANINLMGQLSAMSAKTESPQIKMSNADETFNAAVTENVGHNETAAVVSVDRREANRRADIFQIAGIVWILGVLLTAGYRVCTYKNFVKGINAGCKSVTDQRLLNKVAEIQTRLGIVKEMPLYENAAINIPMLIGLRKPYIALPSKLLAEMAGRENDICLILHHELIHYKRKDIWYKWMFQAVLCVHWFNPLLYLFSHKFNVDCELSCDEAVMAILSEEGRRIYGNVLLDVAEKNLSGKTFGVYRNVPMMTLLEEKCTLKERLREIAKFQKKGIIIGFCSALVLVVFIAAAMVCGVVDVHADSGDVMLVSKSGKPYRMYDDDALIAGESAHDNWQAWNYCGGEMSTSVGKFVLNGSDAVRIVYANKETTLEITSAFKLHSGRFKIVHVMPDQTVQVLNEDGKEISGVITLPEGRNCFKVVGQKARVEDIEITYSGVDKNDIDGIYYSEDEEYAYRVQAGLEPLDMVKLDNVSVYLNPKEVSELYRSAWESGKELSDDNWENLFVYSDEELTSRYLLKGLQDGKIQGFDSHILVEIAPYMSGENLTKLVLALGKDKLTFSDLQEDVIPFLGEEQTMQCVLHYIDLGNILTDSQLQEVQPFVSEKNFYRVIEYNGKKK
ncbi:MAG: M56 family metallopeptidase, partial [Lachnospiraceae bacterium]|nr:M56 family metallopeptidase [Lachnospiraceae bacterium]